MTERIDFFLPGPSYVRSEVREAMTAPVIGHRGAPFQKLYSSLEPRLRRVLRTEGEVLLTTGSATLVMESAIVSTVEKDVLNLTNGAFSERWHAISRAVGRDAVELSFPWGEPVDPDRVREALRAKQFEAVTMVHNETSTGVVSPVEEIAGMIREESDALILVDAVSSLGGAPVETDAWELDLVLAGVQKAMAMPPGIVVFTLSERAESRARALTHRGFYTDLIRCLEKHRQGGTITTPAIPILFAMDRQLDLMLEEGMETRWQRHRELQSMTASWAAVRGFRFASAAGGRSQTVSCLEPPPGVDPRALVSSLFELGITVGGGYGRWKPKTFRIGHMGEVTPEDLDRLLGTIEGLN